MLVLLAETDFVGDFRHKSFGGLFQGETFKTKLQDNLYFGTIHSHYCIYPLGVKLREKKKFSINLNLGGPNLWNSNKYIIFLIPLSKPWVLHSSLICTNS